MKTRRGEVFEGNLNVVGWNDRGGIDESHIEIIGVKNTTTFQSLRHSPACFQSLFFVENWHSSS